MTRTVPPHCGWGWTLNKEFKTVRDESMSKDKPSPGGRSKKNTAVSLVRSSAAEYLTFVAASGQGGVEAVYADENVWLTQKMMALLYDVGVRTINYHLKKVFSDHELEADSVLQYFRITATDGSGHSAAKTLDPFMLVWTSIPQMKRVKNGR
jgi:hypothetical protein